jgi:hypothetical protein
MMVVVPGIGSTTKGVVLWQQGMRKLVEEIQTGVLIFLFEEGHV